MKNFASVLALALLLLAGCAHTPSEEEIPAKKLVWRDLLGEQTNRSAVFQSLTGKLSVEFEGGSGSVRGLGTFGSSLPDNFLLELRDPVGRLHFRAVNRGAEFEGYYPRTQKAYRDKQSGQLFFAKTWSLPVSFKELSRLGAGLLPEGIAPEKKELTWNGKGFAGRMTLQGKTMQVEANEEGALTRVVWESPTGDVEVTWRDFRPCCKWLDTNHKGKELSFAHVIDVKAKNSSIAIDWKSLQNWETASAGKFTIQAEPATKVISLD